MSSDKIEKKLKKNNFFNLSSDEEESDTEKEEKEREEEFQAKIRKWDWDSEENKSLYFNKQKEELTSSKRLKTTDYPSSSIQTQVDKNKNKFRIEKVIDKESCYKYDLLGHDNSVNRIHWCEKSQNKNLLLASSMDR